MPSLSPGNMARGTVLARLADSVTGFNPNYVAALVNYPTAPATAFDFTNTSKNMFVGQVTADQLHDSTAFTYPLMTIYAKAAANKNEQKYQRFAGLVRCYVKVWLSGKVLKASKALHDFEIWGDAIEGAVLETFDSPLPSVQGVWMQNVVYNGDLAWERGDMEESGTNWRQLLTFIASFRVIVP